MSASILSVCIYHSSWRNDCCCFEVGCSVWRYPGAFAARQKTQHGNTRCEVWHFVLFEYIGVRTTPPNILIFRRSRCSYRFLQRFIQGYRGLSSNLSCNKRNSVFPSTESSLVSMQSRAQPVGKLSTKISPAVDICPSRLCLSPTNSLPPPPPLSVCVLPDLILAFRLRFISSS